MTFPLLLVPAPLDEREADEARRFLDPEPLAEASWSSSSLMAGATETERDRLWDAAAAIVVVVVVTEVRGRDEERTVVEADEAERGRAILGI